MDRDSGNDLLAQAGWARAGSHAHVCLCLCSWLCPCPRWCLCPAHLPLLAPPLPSRTFPSAHTRQQAVGVQWMKVQLLQGSRISCRPLTPPPPTTPSLHHTRAGRAARDTSCVPQQCFIEVGWGISPEHPGVSLLRPAGHQHLPDIVFCFLHAPLQV